MMDKGAGFKEIEAALRARRGEYRGISRCARARAPAAKAVAGSRCAEPLP